MGKVNEEVEDRALRTFLSTRMVVCSGQDAPRVNTDRQPLQLSVLLTPKVESKFDLSNTLNRHVVIKHQIHKGLA